ncbi:hypothetical protein [Candidatus Uabimicrobium sp. HlEnr_7]|uniref:hypothetical protein n=1 Tax=Candidatus Uabimicrobium helgolandensis TaxID=3095367 RepID=UPI003555F756
MIKSFALLTSIFIFISCTSSPSRQMIDFNKQNNTSTPQRAQQHSQEQHAPQQHSQSQNEFTEAEPLPQNESKNTNEQETIDLSNEKDDDYAEAKRFFQSIEDHGEMPSDEPKSLDERLEYTALLVKEKSNEEAREAIHLVMSDTGFSQLPIHKKLLAYSLNGQLQMREFNHDSALASFDKALKEFNNSGNVSANSISVVRLIVYYRSRVHNKLANYAESAADMQAYVTLSEQAKQPITSEEYSRLAIAYYLAEDHESCKAVLPNISQEDREQLAEQLEDEMFLTEK